MKVISIIVDEIPESCEKCYLHQCINDRYCCIPLMVEIQPVINFMKHDCPLRKDESKKVQELLIKMAATQHQFAAPQEVNFPMKMWNEH